MNNLEVTRAALHDAASIHTALKARLAGAEAALVEAVGHRHELVSQVARGAEIADKTMKSAGLNVAAAQDSLAQVLEQLMVAAGDEANAQTAFNDAEMEVNLAILATAIRHRISCADALMKAGRDLADADAAYHNSDQAIYSAMRSVGRIPTEYEMNGMRHREHNSSHAVPANIQQTIAQRGSVVFRDLARIERATWGNCAAPDAEADAPHNAAMEAEKVRIGHSQALEQAGKEAQARAAGKTPAWAPERQMPPGAGPFQFLRLGAEVL